MRGFNKSYPLGVCLVCSTRYMPAEKENGHFCLICKLLI
jgi:hypothetical protein